MLYLVFVGLRDLRGVCHGHGFVSGLDDLRVYDLAVALDAGRHLQIEFGRCRLLVICWYRRQFFVVAVRAVFRS